uniref:Uncharacterized protein n=1 Tax=Plectus sambesii TaxID=2011161 RepID=A0A914WDA7_9BILA
MASADQRRRHFGARLLASFASTSSYHPPPSTDSPRTYNYRKSESTKMRKSLSDYVLGSKALEFAFFLQSVRRRGANISDLVFGAAIRDGGRSAQISCCCAPDAASCSGGDGGGGRRAGESRALTFFQSEAPAAF